MIGTRNVRKVRDPGISLFTRRTGGKRYELNDYLGNVRALISDVKLASVANGLPGDFKAQVHAVNDYYPFGSLLPQKDGKPRRTGTGFNGMERDDELGIPGNSYTTFFRQYDPRVGRWLSIDPKLAEQPGWSPYKAYFDNPLYWKDKSGDDETSEVVKPFVRHLRAQKIPYAREVHFDVKVKGQWVRGIADVAYRDPNSGKWILTEAKLTTKFALDNTYTENQRKIFQS